GPCAAFRDRRRRPAARWPRHYLPPVRAADVRGWRIHAAARWQATRRGEASVRGSEKAFPTLLLALRSRQGPDHDRVARPRCPSVRDDADTTPTSVIIPSRSYIEGDADFAAPSPSPGSLLFQRLRRCRLHTPRHPG